MRKAFLAAKGNGEGVFSVMRKTILDLGHKIRANYDDESIVVYQAFNDLIADYAVANKRFGGEGFNPNRMTWIKPSFLWMMYRCGWGLKDENQKRILQIRLPRSVFDAFVREAVLSTYSSEIYETEKEWQVDIARSNVRCQWDPERTPFGGAIGGMRSIQLGLRGKAFQNYNENIIEITDLTRRVHELYQQRNQPIAEVLSEKEYIIGQKD